MAYKPTNPNGQATMANSEPVVIASNQSSIPVTLTSTTITGTVAVTQSGTWDEVGINDSGNSITIDNSTLSVVGGGTEATAMRVTIANDSTGVVSVDDNGGSLTVDGTVAATQSGTWVLGANSGVDIGDVTINNASGASAVNIQDGGNSITVDGTVTANLAAGTNNIGDVDVLTVNGVAPAFGSGVRGSTVQRVTIATDDVVPASQSGTWTVQPGNTANTTAWLVSDVGATSGGLSKFHLVSAASTNATSVKASAGQVYGIVAFNLNAAPMYLKFHNTAGTPTAGTGVTDTFMIPGNTAGAGFVANFDKGIAFGTGIGITLVTGIADSNSTGVAASEVVLQIYYK